MKRLLFFLLISIGASAQNNDAQYQQALKLKAENKFEDALPMFQQLLKSDSGKVEYLYNTAFMLCKLGNRQKDEYSRQDYFHRAEYLSKKAIAINTNEPEAHYTYALALGRINEFASSKQKIANAKLIKNELDATLKLNPKHAGAYHILGRWYRTIAGFNMFEKAMINAFFGGVPPGGSYDSAVACFTKAIQLEPNYLLHKYELAETYHERGNNDDDALTKAWCKQVIGAAAATLDDKETVEKAKALLKKVD